MPPCSRLADLGGGRAQIVYSPWKALRDVECSGHPRRLPHECIERQLTPRTDAAASSAAVLAELRRIVPFPKQSKRRTQKGVAAEGMVLGSMHVLGKRGREGKRIRECRLSSATHEYNRLWQLIHTMARAYVPGIAFTTAQVNKCKPCGCALHVDRRNVGRSYIIALGGFNEGGALQLMQYHIDIHNSMLEFYGQLPHRALPHSGGDRYSIVLFTAGDVKGYVGDRAPSTNFLSICSDPSSMRLRMFG